MSPTPKTSVVPNGWLVAGSHPKNYDMGLCDDTKHSGTRCARIRSTNPSINGFGTLMQSLSPSGYSGQRIKLSAYIKSEDVKEWAGLWMRVDAGKKIASFDNMQDRPIAGNTEWTKYEIVLDVPQESTNISFGVLLSGTGIVWFDDLEFETVSKDVKTTGDMNRSCGIQYQNENPINLDFSQGIRSENKDASINKTPTGWFKQVRAGGETTIGIEEPSKKDDLAAAFIKCSDGAHGALLQAILADKYVGKRLKLSAKVKTDSAGSAGLFYRADAGRKLSICYDYMDDRKITGTTDWTNIDCIIDIPEGSDNIYLGGTLDGPGTVWFKEFKLEEVAQDTPTSGAHGTVAKRKKKEPASIANAKKLVNSSPVNLTFNDKDDNTVSGGCRAPLGWFPAGSHPDRFKMCVDFREMMDGSRCALIEALSARTTGFGTLMQQVEATSYVGKRVRLSAKIKTEEVGWAALWMRIDGPDGEILGFDNMQHNPIKDTTDWNYYECILDVPDTSDKIAFGVLLSGGGKTWFTKVALDAVSSDVETTDIKHILSEQNKPVNLSFEEG